MQERPKHIAMYHFKREYGSVKRTCHFVIITDRVYLCISTLSISTLCTGVVVVYPLLDSWLHGWLTSSSPRPRPAALMC